MKYGKVASDWLKIIVPLSIVCALILPYDVVTTNTSGSTSFTTVSAQAYAEVNRVITTDKSFVGLSLVAQYTDDITVTVECLNDTRIVQTYETTSSQRLNTQYQKVYTCVPGDVVTITHNNQNNNGYLLFISDQYVDRWNPSVSEPRDGDKLP